MKRLFGKNTSVYEQARTDPGETQSNRTSVVPNHPELIRIHSTPVQQEAYPEQLTHEVNIDELLMESRFRRNTGPHSGFEPVTMSKVEKGFEEIYDNMLNKGEILEVTPMQLAQSAINLKQQPNKTGDKNVQQSINFSTQSFMFESCLGDPVPRQVKEVSTSDGNLEAAAQVSQQPENPPPISLDAKILTSLMHTRFRAVHSLLQSSPDKFCPLDPTPSLPAALTVRSLFEKFGENETEEIKRVLRQESMVKNGVRKDKVFLSDLGDLQAVRVAA